MYVQIEITTRCNFSCWYCAGRDMAQEDMRWEVFTDIVDHIPTHGATVSLQGEGEPTLHPRFWDMVRYVRNRGHIPYTIVNGSRLDSEQVNQYFPRIGISIDSLDPKVANSIGRHNLKKVLSNLDALVETVGPKRIVVMTVDLGQPLQPLKDWVKSHNFAGHIVQPLMRKDDYVRSYKGKSGVIEIHPRSRTEKAKEEGPRFCRFLYQDTSRFYTKDGLELPCCFIKDTTRIGSIQQMRNDFAEGEIPPGCRGCREIVR